MTDPTHTTGTARAAVDPAGVQSTLEDRGRTLGMPGGEVGQEVPVAERHGTLWGDAWRELRRNPAFWLSLVLIVVFLLMAIVPSLFTSQNPYSLKSGWTCDLANSLKGPSWHHLMGYDFQGCDVYTLTIYGARASISVGFIVTILTAILGGTAGIVAGYYGGLIDGVISRIIDIFFGMPYILGGIVILTIIQAGGIIGVVVALTVLGWVSTARIARSSVISIRDADFVVAAKSLGASTPRILLKHVLPNSLAPLIVVSTVGLGAVIASEATFSFLGIGVQPPTTSWGQQISDASAHFLEGRHALLFPSATLTVAVLSFILLGDAVREALDPKLR